MSPLSLLGLAIDFLAVAAVTAFFANAGRLFGPKSRHEGDADMPYETGMPPLAPSHEQMSALYHRFAVLFVVFDVDLAFLLPWALNRPFLNFRGLCAISVFVLLLLFMLAYFWRKGMLECN